MASGPSITGTIHRQRKPSWEGRRQRGRGKTTVGSDLVPIGTLGDIASRPFILIERRHCNATHDNFSAMSHIRF
jgi:hypothetical protein